MSYTHLSQDERYQIQHLRKGGFWILEIARQIDRAGTTVSRELIRNGNDNGYEARRAQRQSVQRRHVASATHRRGGLARRRSAYGRRLES